MRIQSRLVNARITFEIDNRQLNPGRYLINLLKTKIADRFSFEVFKMKPLKMFEIVLSKPNKANFVRYEYYKEWNAFFCFS